MVASFKNFFRKIFRATGHSKSWKMGRGFFAGSGKFQKMEFQFLEKAPTFGT
jgi:hypothetical protein